MRTDPIPTDPPFVAEGFPAVISDPIAGLSADEFAAWLRAQSAPVRALLQTVGAVLFRGAVLDGAPAFEAVARSFTPDLVDYVGGGSPRTRVGGSVYTSTEYASKVTIPLHCEASYLPQMPATIWFYCHRPSATGGQTPIGDMRRAVARLDPDLVAKFRDLGVLYVTNLHDGRGFGKSWAQAYETDDRAEVERRLAAQGVDYAWTDDGGLRVLLRAAAERPHPETGDAIWVNQAVNWHPVHLGQAHFQRMIGVFGEQIRFPKAVFYGDGTEIPATVIAEMQAALSAEEVAFDWQSGDVLLLDNRRIAHGRRPFEGERSVYVALA